MTCKRRPENVIPWKLPEIQDIPEGFVFSYFNQSLQQDEGLESIFALVGLSLGILT
jgi:hypothetical protein